MNHNPPPMIAASHLLGGLILLLALARLAGGSLPAFDLSAVILWGMLLVLYTVVLWLAGPMARGLWTGYIYFCITAAGLMFDVTASLVLIVIGTALATGLLYRTAPPESRPAAPLTDMLARLGINGSAAFLGYSVYQLIGGSRPFDEFSDVTALGQVLLANVVVYLVLVIAGTLLTGRSMSQVPRYILRTWLLDASLQFAALLVPVVYFVIGIVPALIIMVLVLFQAVRFHQVSMARSQLVKRARDVSTLSSLGQALSSNLSLDEVLAQVHSQLYELVQPTLVQSVLYDEASDVLEFPAVTTAHGAQRAHKRRLSSGLIDRVVRERRLLQLNLKDPSDLAALGFDATHLTVRAFVGVPLMVGDRLVGALAVGHETNPDAFDTLDIAVLQTIAAQAALAIRNANLFSRTLRLSNNLAILNQSMQQVMFNLDRASLAQTACLIACQITGAERAAVYVVQERLGLKLAGHAGMDRLESAELAIPYRPEIYTEGARVDININAESPLELREMAAQVGFRAALEVPLRSSHTLVGVLAVYHDEPHFFENADISLLEMLANQVTAAFDNTDLLQALEIYASEQAQLVYLSRVSSTNLDLERVVVDLSAMLSQMVMLPRVDVGLLAGIGHMDVYRIVESDQVTVERLPMNSLPEVQIALATPQLVNPYVLYADDESLSPEATAYMTSHSMKVLVIMPMTVSRQVLGVLLLSASEAIPVTDTMRRLLEMAIHQVSAQVHNARLYTITEQALSQQLEQLSLIEDLSYKISQSLNVRTIADNVLDAVLRATLARSAQIVLQTGRQRWQIFEQTPDSAMTQRTVVEADIHADVRRLMQQPDGLREEVSLHEGRTIVCLGLLSGERPLGVLRVVGDQDSRLGTEELNFIRSLSGHATVSIDNAFLLEERQFQVNALSLLRELSLEVMGSVDDSRITEAILRTTLNLMAADEAALYGYDTRTDEIVPMVGLRRVSSAYEVVEPRMATQAVYDAIATRTVTHYDDLTLPGSETPDTLPFVTVAAVPIVRHGEVTEVLVMGFHRPRELERRDLNFVDLLAVQVASHLENVLLGRAIQTSNKRMRAILDSTRDGIILLDNFGRILDANRRANDLLSADVAGAVGETFSRVIRQQFSDTPWAAQMSLLGTEPVGEFRDVELPRGEATLYLQTSTLPVRDANGSSLGRLLSIRDITEDRQLANLRESLQRMVIHDLRSPMGAIMTGLSFLQVLVDELEPDVARDMRRTLEASLESADNLMRLMDTLRDIPRMKDITLDMQSIAIRTLIMKAYESLEALFKDAHIRFELRVEQEVQVKVDIDLMRRVLVNLLHNALKFTPEGGTILIITSEDITHGLLHVRVCDTGPGIPLNMRERIFGEFQQVEGQLPKRGGRGTGLGLTLCKLAVEAHGGTIWVDGDGPLPGACFRFTLPLPALPVGKAI